MEMWFVLFFKFRNSCLFLGAENCDNLGKGMKFELCFFWNFFLLVLSFLNTFGIFGMFGILSQHILTRVNTENTHTKKKNRGGNSWL